MSSGITLSAGVRANLLSLQNTAQLMQTTQNRLATGKKVNSALDNPLSYFTSQSLGSRASDLSALLDSMSNGIQTIQAANNGLTSITSNVQSMQSTLNQALQDKSFQTASYTVDPTIDTSTVKNLALTGGALGTSSVNVALNTVDTAATTATLTGASGTDFSAADPDFSALDTKTVTITAGSNTASYTFDSTTTGQLAAMQTAFSAAGFTVAGTAGGLDFSRADGNFTVTTTDTATGTALGIGAVTTKTSTDGVAGITGAVKTVDQIVTAINADTSLTGKVTASNDNGKLRLQNISTSALDITGASATTADGSASTTSIAGNDVRKGLVQQFNTLRDQLNKFADDASYNGVNLLRGDNLKLTLNETGTSALNIQAKDANGNTLTIDSTSLGIDAAQTSDFNSDATINDKLSKLTTALSTLRSQASSFGSNLSIVQNRQNFTNSMINTLQTGGDNLVLADSNQEGANLLALQTRQSLSTTALSLSAQADQAVLSLFQ